MIASARGGGELGDLTVRTLFLGRGNTGTLRKRLLGNGLVKSVLEFMLKFRRILEGFFLNVV